METGQSVWELASISHVTFILHQTVEIWIWNAIIALNYVGPVYVDVEVYWFVSVR